MARTLSRPLRRCGAIELAASLIGLTSPAQAGKRLDLYDAQGHHSGYAIVDRRAGRVDYYDLRDRRMGWGRVNPLSERYRIDLFGSDGIAIGYALINLGAGRVEFFNAVSHPVGTGTIDKMARVATFDPTGRRRTDTALPIQALRPAGSRTPSPPTD